MFSTYWVIRSNNIISLVGVSVKYPDRLYWFGGSSYTIITPEIEVLHSYHIEDFINTEDPEDAIEISFWKYWNVPVSGNLSGTGWLAPDGTFYGCEYTEHDSLAKQIVAVFYEELTGYVERLENEGWVRLQTGFVILRGNKLTQAQLNTLQDISQQPTINLLEKAHLEQAIRYGKKDIL
jgi:hypothetical protein